MLSTSSAPHPDPLRLAEALTEGLRAGRLLLGAGCIPYELGTPEASEWLRGHQQAAGETLHAGR